MIRYRIAETEEDRAAAFRLRYEVFVEDMQLLQEGVDHEQRQLRDNSDDYSEIFLAEDAGEIVGCTRATRPGARFNDHARASYDVERFLGIVEESEIAVASRLVFRPQYRGTTLAFDLFEKVMEWLAERGVEMTLGSCQPYLLNFYWSYGFRPFGKLDDHPTNGILARIAVVMGDFEHFRRIDTPMRPALSRRTKPVGDLSRLLEAVHRGNAIRCQVATALDDYCDEVTKHLKIGDRLQGFLDGLPQEVVRRLLARSHLLTCAAGDMLFRPGQSAPTLYMLLDGSLEASEDEHGKRRLEAPGTLTGRAAPTGPNRYQSKLIAGNRGARVVALNRLALSKLVPHASDLALC